MCPSSRRLTYSGALGMFVAAVLVLTGRATGAEPEASAAQLAAARETLKKAQTGENVARDARSSLDMARAATGAIVSAARETLAKAAALQRETEDDLKQIAEDARVVADEAARAAEPKKKALLEESAQIAAAKVEAEQLLVKRVARVKSYQEQLAKDEAVANRAAASYQATEKQIIDSILATWNALEQVQALEARIARTAADQAAADHSAAEKGVAEKAAAAKTAAERAAAEPDAAKKKTLQEVANRAAIEKQTVEKALAAKAAAAATAANRAIAAEATFRQTQAAAAWDTHELAVSELDRAEQELRGKSAAAQRLTQQAAAEKDPARKKTATEAAGRATAEAAALEQRVIQQRADVRAGAHRVYSLRVVALGGLKPLSPEAWDYARARHLLARAGFGGTPQEVQQLCDMGLYRAVDHLVNFHLQPAADVPFDAVPPPAADPIAGRLRLPGAAARAQAEAPRTAAYNGQDGRLVQWWLRRMVESPRPLQEKLTLFWHGHFATQASVVRHSYATYHHNQMLREHAAGNFGALLYGMVHDPVMIRYLDNNTNVKGHANENLAREIMELFSMGAYQGYTEADVREAARALTGYTFDGQSGQFRLAGASHDASPKKVFGREGNWTGDDLVKLILEQPTTSRFVARKLFEFFVHDAPSPAAVEQLAAQLRAYNYELAPVLQNLFLSEEFYGPSSVGSQIKCPVQVVVGTLRTLGVKQVTDAGALHTATTAMGQQLFEPPDVKGWRYGRAWVSSARIFVRYNATADLVRKLAQPEGRRGIDLVTLVEAGGCRDSAQVVDYLLKTCYVAPPSAETRARLLDFVKDLPAADQWARQRAMVNGKLQSLVVLMTSTPEYQVN